MGTVSCEEMPSFHICQPTVKGGQDQLQLSLQQQIWSGVEGHTRPQLTPAEAQLSTIPKHPKLWCLDVHHTNLTLWIRFNVSLTSNLGHFNDILPKMAVDSNYRHIISQFFTHSSFNENFVVSSNEISIDLSYCSAAILFYFWVILFYIGVSLHLIRT